MTPGDVHDALIADETIRQWRDYIAYGGRDQSGDAQVMFHALLDVLRPGPDARKWLPLSPLELERLRVSLRAIANALDVAEAHAPKHFYLVKDGGR